MSSSSNSNSNSPSSKDQKKKKAAAPYQKLRSVTHVSTQEVNVETLENGFLINVFHESHCPGLLVSVLETFDAMGLDVLHANVSCSRNFHLEAIGGKNEEMDDGIDAQVVKQRVLEAIKRWNDHDHEPHND